MDRDILEFLTEEMGKLSSWDFNSVTKELLMDRHEMRETRERLRVVKLAIKKKLGKNDLPTFKEVNAC